VAQSVELLERQRHRLGAVAMLWLLANAVKRAMRPRFT
jgi:hypothetical protein